MTRSRRTRRPKFNTQETRTSLNRRKVKTIKSDENLILYFVGLACSWSNSLNSFISAPVRLIGKRGLICDHSQLINISLTSRRNCLLFEKIFVYFSVKN